MPELLSKKSPADSVVMGRGQGHGRDGTGQSTDTDKKFLMSGTSGQFISCDIVFMVSAFFSLFS